MRRIVVALTASVLALGLMVGGGPAKAAVPGYDASFFGESAYLTMTIGQTGQFVGIFTNSGATGWAKNTASQVNLGICLADKVTCNVPSPNASWNDGTWFSTIAYATSTTDFVAPGQNAFFTYNVKAPFTASPGTFTFNGDLVLGSTGQQIRPQGYFHQATILLQSNDVTPPTAAFMTSGYPQQAGLTVLTKGSAFDADGVVVSVLVKVQRNDAGVWTDVTSYTPATPDDGSFNTGTEAFTHTTGNLTIPNGVPVQVQILVTDAGANTNVFTDILSLNGGLWSTAPLSTDTTPPTIVGSLCIDPRTSSSLTCGVYASTTTPTASGTVVFSALASDNTAVTGAEYAVTAAGTGNTVRDWTPCAPGDGAFGAVQEFIACTVQFPTTPTPQGGTGYVILMRAVDAAGNRGTPADATTGVFGVGQFCTFFTSQYASGSAGPSTTANCVWKYDNSRPYVSQTTRAVGTAVPMQPLDQSSEIVIGFSKEMRPISTSSPQSITVTDGLRTVALTSGLNASFYRCFNGITVFTPGICASTNDGSAGTGVTWQIIPTINTGLIYPLTITNINNFSDYAGNTVIVGAGDVTID